MTMKKVLSVAAIALALAMTACAPEKKAETTSSERALFPNSLGFQQPVGVR